MPMCSTGTIAVLSAPQGGCSSLSSAICNTTTGPISLCKLEQCAGVTLGSSVLNFHGYDNLIADVNFVSNIPNTGGICNCPKMYGPAPISFTMSTDSPSWIILQSPVTMSPTGVAQPVCICANVGSARSGVVCFIPSTGAGGIKCTTFSQLLGVVCKCIVLSPVSSSACGGATACATVGICATPALVAGDCFSATLGAYMNTGGQGVFSGSFACWRLTCNGVSCVSCTIPGNVCCYPNCTVVITSANISLWCMMMCASTTSTSCPACSTSMGCIQVVTPTVGCEIIGSPSTCQMCTG